MEVHQDLVNAESIERIGLKFVTEENPTAEQTIDLVAIHGLGGDFYETWTDKNTNQNWLEDFLPKEKELRQLRIMSWGYNSMVLGSNSTATITTFAQSLLGDLKTARPNELQKRPLIFVCHSLGGLVFKRVS
jgi:hypothetical protein